MYCMYICYEYHVCCGLPQHIVCCVTDHGLVISFFQLLKRVKCVFLTNILHSVNVDVHQSGLYWFFLTFTR